MSTEDGVRSFLQYLSEDSGYTVQEQRTILQTLRDMLDTLIEKVRGLLTGGDARRMAEKADQLEAVCAPEQSRTAVSLWWEPSRTPGPGDLRAGPGT